MNSKENQQYILNKWKNLIDCTGSELPKAVLIESQESWLTDRNNASKATDDGQLPLKENIREVSTTS